MKVDFYEYVKLSFVEWELFRKLFLCDMFAKYFVLRFSGFQNEWLALQVDSNWLNYDCVGRSKCTKIVACFTSPKRGNNYYTSRKIQYTVYRKSRDNAIVQTNGTINILLL